MSQLAVEEHPYPTAAAAFFEEWQEWRVCRTSVFYISINIYSPPLPSVIRERLIDFGAYLPDAIVLVRQENGDAQDKRVDLPRLLHLFTTAHLFHSEAHLHILLQIRIQHETNFAVDREKLGRLIHSLHPKASFTMLSTVVIPQPHSTERETQTVDGGKEEEKEGRVREAGERGGTGAAATGSGTAHPEAEVETDEDDSGGGDAGEAKTTEELGCELAQITIRPLA
jgi:hypothetical protein